MKKTVTIRGVTYWRSARELARADSKKKADNREFRNASADVLRRDCHRSAFYALVEKHTAGLRRVDVFSRESRPGWTAFGNEIGKFDGVAA